MQETAGLPVFTKDGLGVHRDLCYVSRCIHIEELESLKLPGDVIKGGGALFYVSACTQAVPHARVQPWRDAFV